jgi:Protein of unknown function DUF262
MEIDQTQDTVANYCNALRRDEIEVNRDYQRSDRVWPLAARQFLIETILLDYPIPKLSLHQVTHLKTKTSRRYVVDGQQRTRSIFDFFNNDLRLSRSTVLPGCGGRRLDELPDEYQEQFLNYLLSLDLLQNALPEEVRDVFRRINAYTVPLNPEESRHARFQGPFKWFVYRIASDFSPVLQRMGTFSEKQLVRMQDTKLVAEITHAIVNGVQTTTKAKLDRLYRDYDREFPMEEQIEGRFRRALERLSQLDQIFDSELAKSYQVYALVLALMHFDDPLTKLVDAVPPVPHGPFDPDEATNALAIADEALVDDATTGPYKDYVKASSSKTNVGDERVTRIATLYEALQGVQRDAP